MNWLNLQSKTDLNQFDGVDDVKMQGDGSYWLKNIHDVDDVLGAFHDGVDGGDEHELRNNYLDRERLLLRH